MSTPKGTPNALWQRVWKLLFSVNDDDWKTQVPKLREMARLISALIHAIEEPDEL